MDYNLGFIDIIVRYAVIMLLGILFGITQWFVLIVLAIAVFISAVSGVCPLYSIFGISTLPEEQK